MKIQCEVLGVTTNGESLVITAQGTVRGAAGWRLMSAVKFDVPDGAKNQRAFHVGREFTLTVSLKP